MWYPLPNPIPLLLLCLVALFAPLWLPSGSRVLSLEEARALWPKDLPFDPSLVERSGLDCKHIRWEDYLVYRGLYSLNPRDHPEVGSQCAFDCACSSKYMASRVRELGAKSFGDQKRTSG